MKRLIRRHRVVLVVRHVEGQSSSESRAVTQKIAQREPLFFIPRVVCGSASAKCETPGYTQLLSLLFQRRRRRFAKRAGASVAEESCRSLHTRVEMGAGRPVSSFTDVSATRDRLARRQRRGPGRLPGPGSRGSPAAFDLIAAAGRALDSFGVPGGWGALGEGRRGRRGGPSPSLLSSVFPIILKYLL